MVLSDVVSPNKGKAFMLCNEAIARGAIEADVKVVAFYPGAPTSEILDTFSEALGSFDYQMQIATNEKVALEICAGASFAGFRSLTAMKSVGMNVASDTLFVLGYTGVRGGMVIVMADDPHAHSSQSEQDGRFFAPNSYIPMLEPATAQEAKDMVKEAFSISERHRVPVIVRTVTRVNHQSGVVELEEIRRSGFSRARWRDLKEEYLTLGEVARRKKLRMLERRASLEGEFEKSAFNHVLGGDAGAGTGIVTSSVAYLHVLEALKNLGISGKVPVLKLGTTYPVPRRLVAGFLKGLGGAVVVEELSPYLENEVAIIAKDENPGLRIFGKRSGHFSEAWELNPDLVAKGLASALGVPYEDKSGIVEEARALKEGMPERYPTFCPGCPHRGTFAALSQALRALSASGKGYYFANDIGCYSMWVFPPISNADSSLCMVASVGIANGLSNVVEERVVAVVGDSTFYHAALPAILNAIHNRNRFTLLVLDNSVTAMTGQQPNLSTEFTAGGREGKRVPIEDICRAAGAEFVEVIDAYQVKENVPVIRRALEHDGLAIVVSRRECALYGDRRKRRRGEKITPFYVDKSACRRPYACIRDVYCPAHEIDGDGQPRISPELCDGCSVCSRVCAFGSIRRAETEGERR
ncbi:MAG: Indolepyruvate oxidoreductase subunit IorA [Candidatus Methanosuratincola subterraneus]|uniref:Indolepyruvate oxidoreductase subunit IorA n=1 Tax=Methanosuratincola subterraneus TaxID=2593994 RepID=A0A444L7E6_METS7|nr:MAG: Indolepyruvate oxidoreductase subunit IorA [Candidatus Methanosuratincola subterraneus]